VRKGFHRNGEYLFFGEGVHVRPSPYVSVERQDIHLTEGVITHGTKAIITVTQGFVGMSMDRGQPVLLPPGLHQWDSQTLKFDRLIDLASNLICLGPYTLVTVDEGYAAVTQDNGAQKILAGGSAYMLTHRNWKFEKFITQKLQTNDVGPIKVTTGDNVPLEAKATVNWLIEDAQLAARVAANTMIDVSRQTAQCSSNEFDISKLREDVIRQVTASLAAFIGSVSYAAHGHAAMAARVEGDGKTPTNKEPDPDPEAVDSTAGRRALFDREQLNSSVEHANEICNRYGVNILSINLISATPSDHGLLDALSKGAVATVAAEQVQTAARGEAQALLTKARAEAEAAKIRAEGDAQAERIHAEGSLQAAQQLEASDVAVQLAKMKAAGQSLKEGKANSFFFGLQGAQDVPAGILGSAMVADSMGRR
jgi:regulator of protease activity HflC (stomatin/prohibitin superfamily)